MERMQFQSQAQEHFHLSDGVNVDRPVAKASWQPALVWCGWSVTEKRVFSISAIESNRDLFLSLFGYFLVETWTVSLFRSTVN